MTKNPFLDIPLFPDFAAMTPELADEALTALLPACSAAFDKVERDIASRLEDGGSTLDWNNCERAVYEATLPLGDAWGMVCHLISVMNSDGWRAVQEKFIPQLVPFFLRVSQSDVLYRAYRALRDRDAASPFLSHVQRRILAKAILDMEHSGVALAGEAKARFNAIQQELATLTTTFRNHLLDATKAFSLTLTKPEEVEGLPESLRAVTAQAAGGDKDKGPWKITLDLAVYLPFIKYSRNAAAREAVFRAHCTRASSGETDNTEIIERILALRREYANLLGYATYADLNLSSKMAKTVQNVDALVEQLADAARDVAKRENEELEAFADADPRSAALPYVPWNVAFWAECRREALYDYSDEELSRYFPFERVLDGLFALAGRLFGIRIAAADGEAPVWHKDVRFFRVSDASDGRTLAYFYLDPFSRPETKSGGAWMNHFRTLDRRPDGTVTLPVAVLVCNQTVPVGGAEPVMRLREIETLFHEFGHSLQHMLTVIDIPAASGMEGVEWDAVEIASQFMENWCYDYPTLASLSRHAETGETLPESLFRKVLAAKNYRAATDMMRQLHLGATDMDLYARYPREGWKCANDVKEYNDARFVTTPVFPEDRFLCGFSHIFGGGYAAGYYSYKWSEVLSADAFSAFEEAGLDNEAAVQATGRRYRDTILSMGGGTDPAEVFRLFRGRDPSIDAILRHAGLKAQETGNQ
ncbi:MAG: M3 family metallopeptidase [Kiritimatiellae bacterium]|nr:M3 family metallopeptidase [Kiritimatiellia bacterium]